MTMRKSAAITKKIKAANAALGKAVAQGDAEAVANMYSKNPILMPPNAPATRSKTGIKKFWAGAVQMGVAGASLRTSELEVSGDTAIEVGNYRLTDKKKKTLDTGKYIVIWKKEGKDWKLHRDIFNSNS